MNADLERAIAADFAHYSTDQLVRRIERAPDFGYDDEAVELNRRLRLGGMAWRWTQDGGPERVEIYQVNGEDGDEANQV